MGNVGITEVLLCVSIPLIGAFLAGFFLGKGVGFKEGLREPRK